MRSGSPSESEGESLPFQEVIKCYCFQLPPGENPEVVLATANFSSDCEKTMLLIHSGSAQNELIAFMATSFKGETSRID